MSLALSFWVATLGVFFYVFSVDPNVPLFCELYLRKIRAKVRGWIYMVQWNPNLPWGNYNIWREATKNSQEIARELSKEFNLPEE